jgi:signal transduction histidine kinase/CheY-like chemotaxis protein
MTTRLRRRLVLLATVTIVPLALVSGLALRALLEHQAEQTELAAINLSRALATGVDNELRLSVSALQSLALTDAIGDAEGQSLAAARYLAVRALASRPEWRAVLLLKPSGEVFINTGYPVGADIPKASDPASLAQIAATRAPVIGSLAYGPQGNPGIAIRVPVLRDGELRHVLAAILRPEAVHSIITRQRVPGEWMFWLSAGTGRPIARSRDHERYVGTSPGPSLNLILSQLGERDQVYGESQTVEGGRVHTAVARIGNTGWTVALGVPTTVIQGASRSSALAYGGGIVLSVLIGGLAAWLVSRSIEQPIERLKASAQSLGRGDPISGAGSDITEIEAMSDALVRAADQRVQAAVEREQLFAAERNARASAERANERLQVLASAGAVLSSVLDESAMLQSIATVLVPAVADMCRIDLLDRDGVLQRKLTHHRDPERARQVAAFVSQELASPDTPGTFPWVIATGKSFFANFASEAEIAPGDASAQQFVRLSGLRAVCVVPLIARGRTLGAMAVIQADSGRSFEPEDQAMVSELARRASLALDNGRLLDESQAALSQASIAGRAKDEFLAVLGHELRNPLAPIVTSLALMRRKSGGSDNDREREIIERQVRHLQRLVDDLLDVSRIARGKIELKKQSVDLADIVARSLELTHPALVTRQSAPNVVLPDEPVRVQGDATRLTQVLCNLLTNAVKYSPPDADITIQVRRADGQAELAVSDQGIGIEADLLPHVFDQFVQGRQALNRAAGGLGLGLAIAKNLIELHGGTITASSPGPGQGSIFVVRMPESHALADVAVSGRPDAARHDAPKRILVVDDNTDAAKTLAELLRMAGHQVQTAADGHEAIASVDSFVPDIAILDIGLPGMDGYELARWIRKQPRLQRVRLIALSGYGQASDQKLALEAGFDLHLAKPVDPEVVLTTIQELDPTVTWQLS